MKPIQHPSCNDILRRPPGTTEELPTPITDAAERLASYFAMTDITAKIVPSKVARDLERQLAEARARVQKWMDQCSDMGFELIISRDELAKAREQRDQLAKACKSAKLCLSGEALPTRHRAILIINAALASME